MKKLFLKTMMLTAALVLGVGQSWAQDPTVYFSRDYELDGATCDWTSGNTDRYTATLVTSDANHYVECAAVGNGNNGTTVTGPNMNVASGTDFTLIFKAAITGGNGSNAQQSTLDVKDASGANDILKLYQTTAGGINWTINDIESQTVDLTKGAWYTFTVTRSDSRQYLTIEDAEGTELVSKLVIKVLSDAGGLSNMVWNTKRYNANFKIDDIVVRETISDDIPAVSYFTMTTTFVNKSSEKIKPDVSELAQENTEYTPTYPTTFDDETNRYTYESGATTFTVTEDHTFTLVYTSEPLADHTVTFVAKAGENVIKTLNTIIVKDAKDAYYKYPAYVLGDDNTWYSLASSDATNGHTASKTNVTSDVTVNITATAVANGFTYIEAEDVAGAVRNTAWDGRTASGAGAAFGSEQVVATLLPGKYVITACFGGKAGSNNFTLTLGSNTITGSSATQFGTISLGSLGEPIVITETTNLVATGGYQTTSQNASVWDYFFIQKTADIVAVTDLGWASYCSPSNLTIPADVEAYYASKVGSESVTLTALNAGNVVPAGFGMLIKATEGNYTFNIAATSTVSVDNKLSGTLVETATADLKEADKYKIYVLGKVDEEAKLCNFTGDNVPANKAYLRVAAAAKNPAPMRFVFEDEATGISQTMTEVKMSNGQSYNLQGQKVAADYKGIVIMNGKKVVMK